MGTPWYGSGDDRPRSSDNTTAKSSVPKGQHEEPHRVNPFSEGELAHPKSGDSAPGAVRGGGRGSR